MQAIAYPSAAPTGNRIHFARKRRDYMMRSEKRDYAVGSKTRRPDRKPDRKPPKRKRRRAGFFYKLLTLMLLMLIWPIGVVMLWRRKLRWKISTKLLTSIITLVLSIVLFGVGLTVDTGVPAVTRTQDAVNDYLDHFALRMADTYSAIVDTSIRAYDGASELVQSASRAGAMLAGNGIKAGLEWVEGIRGSTSRIDEDADPVVMPGDEPGAATFPPEAISALKADSTEDPTETAAVATPFVRPESDPKNSPEQRPEDEAPVVQSGGEAESAQSEAPATHSRQELDESAKVVPETTVTTTPGATEASTETPIETPVETSTETPEVTPDPRLKPKAAAEAVVYYNDSGVGYHMASSCVGMSIADKHTLSEAIEAGKRPCRHCNPPSGDFLEKEQIVWADEEKVFHLSDECDAFQGTWELLPVQEALEEGLTPCKACLADQYVANINGNGEPVEPEAVAREFSVSLKPVAEAEVYHSSNGKYYHTFATCSGMTGGEQFTLEECVNQGYKTCRNCGAPSGELIGVDCLWQDESGLCHTTDECDGFNGRWTLVPLKDALAEGLKGCPDCGGQEYLTQV
ncbi:MAG: hypothetical protein U0L09_02180 [Christensenellales bacterium]|nr:hypothetical protein [Christensenellales bacterium]